MIEAVNNCWTARQMKRQIDSMLYERLLLSNDKEAVLAMARKEKLPETPKGIVKDPMVLSTLPPQRTATYSRSGKGKKRMGGGTMNVVSISTRLSGNSSLC